MPYLDFVITAADRVRGSFHKWDSDHQTWCTFYRKN